MSGNSIGVLFRITTAGESHGKGNIVIIDGHPAGIPLTEAEINLELARRRPGQSDITTMRKEKDEATILSGVFNDLTTGTSLAIFIPNEDCRSRDYSNVEDTYRPGHADFTYDQKYGIRDFRGGGRSSARETVARVAAGVVASKILSKVGVMTVGHVKRVGGIEVTGVDLSQVTREQVDANAVRCPDAATAQKMIALIKEVRSEGDSIGGVAEFVIRGVPGGWGEPVFDKLKADLAKALLSIPAVNGFEYGAGFHSATLKGSEFNDEFQANTAGKISTASNRHGGMLGGISSGEMIVVRVSLRPTASIAKEQNTVNKNGEKKKIRVHGRHDPCLLPRFIPIGEAMINIVLADHYLRSLRLSGKF
jgi:chorismate synthase